MNSRVRRSAAPTALALLVAGLSLSLGCTAPGGGPYGLPACTSDAQCQPGEQCFSDGCGDLGGDLAAEVSPEARAGQFAQDFAFETVGPIQDFRVVPTTALSGILRSASTEDDEGHVTPGQPYVGRVTLQLAGTSSVIPGLHRSANLSTDLSDGRFTVPAPSGTYVGTLTTADPRFPPLRFEVEIAPGTQEIIALQLPDVEALREIPGRVASLGLPLGQSLWVEPLHPETMELLGQPVRSDPLTGAFTLSLASDADGALPAVRLRVTPTATPANHPTRVFDEVVPDPAETLELELGAPLPQVRLSGTLRGPAGRVIVGATVYAEVQTPGGGTSRSQSVQSDAEGRFTLHSFPSSDQGARLWIVPPAREAAGQTQLTFTLGALPHDLGEVVLPYRMPVRIAVLDPETGAQEENAVVIADPVAAYAEDLPLPTYGAEGITLTDGVLMWLEPGVYRVSVRRGPQRPRLTRVLAVPPVQSSLEGPPPEQFETVHTTVGRTVTGTVISKGEPTTRPIAGAVIRYTRVLHLEHTSTHVVLAETTTSEDGTYSVILPTVPH